MLEVDTYLKQLTKEQKDFYEKIKSIVKKIAPEAVETMSYGMPTFKYSGGALIGFAVHTNHVSVYPFDPSAIEKFRDRLEKYETSKGTIRFTIENPLDEKVITGIVKFRFEKISTGKK